MKQNAYFVYTNDLGASVEFSGSSPFLPTEADGIFGLPVGISTSSQYGQDGETVAGQKLSARQVSIGARIMRDVIDNRIHLLETFHPKHGGVFKLIRGDFVRCLRCVVEQAPSFSPVRGDIFNLTLKAPNPYWQAERERRVDVATWLPAFEWPLEVPPGGIEFGYRTPSKVINIYNAGDVPAGIRVVFRATGSVTNPALVNVTTYKHIKLNMEMRAGDRATVTTGYGEKRVRLFRADQTQEENAFALLDPYSTFLQLARGANLYRHAADEGESSLNVSVFHTPQYLGV